MRIVRLALRRPYTFIALALLIAILGTAAIFSMPVDIFPYIDIPIVSIVWQYNGLTPQEMESRIVTNFERGLTSNVIGIEHIESQSYQSTSVVRVFFHPNVQVELALSQVVTQCQVQVRNMPPGTFPPQVLKYDAASVPILQLGLSSTTLKEQEIFDLANNFIRTPLAIVQGANVSYPFGGKTRQMMVDINLDELYARQLSPLDVSNALNIQNLILPAGTAKFGRIEYPILLNSSPTQLADFNNLPIKTVNGAVVYMRDIGTVRDGFTPQQNIVRTNGNRGVLLTVTRNGNASTLSIVDEIRKAMPRVMATIPKELKLSIFGDQSLFVRASIAGVLRETLIAAFLTGTVILLLLGSWRSTLIVCISIPLSILTSLCFLSLLGQTINVMTLGGMALAVGILVDDATVEIENTHRNLAMRKPLVRAVLDGASQIAVPTLVSTLAICIVFVPVLLLTGTARYLFTPLAMAVVFAMLASYFLSRTLVPTMVHHLLRPEVAIYQSGSHGGEGLFWSLHRGANFLFERLRYRYMGLLDLALRHRLPVLVGFLAFSLGSLALGRMVGRDFFPEVDAGVLRLHARTIPGTRLEQTELRFADLENEIRAALPSGEIDTILDNIGIPNAWGSLAQGDVPNIGALDGEILISLKPEKHRPTREAQYVLRKRLAARFPEMMFFFEPANITNQIINFGLPAPFDVQVMGRDLGNYTIAERIRDRISAIPGAVDVHIHQVVSQPQINVNVDRVKAGQVGLTQRDVTGSLLISLSGNNQVAPNFWLNPANGVSYNVGVQTSQYRVDSLDALLSTPLTAPSATTTGAPPGTASGGASPNGRSLDYGNPGAVAGGTQLLSNLVDVKRSYGPVIVNHYNVAPVYDVYANVGRRDLGTIGEQVQRIVGEESRNLPRGTTIELRGEFETMQSSFFRLGLGMIFAVALVYLLMAVNFQSWIDPLIILTALPGAVAGVLWILFVTGTTLSVPSLMGSLMCIGVATANSILIVTFANEERGSQTLAGAAMYAAAYARLRPVLMTAAAMILGMLPMALGLGEGGEQNAPLGRAVIGGLMGATLATLFFVPIIYTYFRTKPPVDTERKFDEEERTEEMDSESLIGTSLMRYSDPQERGPENEPSEDLQWQIDDLKRQLHEERRKHVDAPPPSWKPKRLTILAIALTIAVLFAGAFFAGYFPRTRIESEVRADADERSKTVPRMAALRVGAVSQIESLNLPGTLQAVTEAPILPRIDGYLKSRLADIGDHVKAGQALAEIDAPELDQQIRQARAAINQAQASLEQAQANVEQGKAARGLASVTANRWKNLSARGVVSRQEDDQYQAQLASQNASVQALEKALQAQQSNLAAAQANLGRLQEIQSYRVVKAPFDGVITQRNVDQGALVNTGSTLLYRIAQIATLRTYVNAPQANVVGLQRGQAARLTVSNFPGRRFSGTIARTANSLDPSTRTMLVEIDVPNDGSLFPGMFVEVELRATADHPPIVIPASALITRADGAQVAVVREGGVLHLQKIAVGRDYGDRVEILQGLQDGAEILASPGESAREGTRVEPIEDDR